jgi:hypothetical protein
MLPVLAAMATLGWFMAHNPARVVRFFSLGIDPPFGKELASTFFKVVGWVYCAGSSTAVVFYMVLIALDTIHLIW